jgi:SAM-dependent methyltransferase
MEDKSLSALISIMNDVQNYFMNELEGGIATHAANPESWAYVGINIEWALSQLRFVREYFPENASPSFIDCGAGLGFISILARNLGFKATGIEFSTRYVELARKLFPHAQTFEGDMLTFDNYAQYDVIFYYGPFKDEVFQEQFEHKVEAEAKSGAIIIANRKVSEAWRTSAQFRLLKEDTVVSWIIQKV